jgi:hypothetical protein
MDDQEQMLALIQQDPTAARRLLEAQMAEQAAANPMLAMVMQMITSRRESGERDAARVDRGRRVERVRTHLHELRTALTSAHELLDDLAAALGACAACWGDADACPACRGRGAPGWRAPDDDLFDELVAPAVKRRARTNPPPGTSE